MKNWTTLEEFVLDHISKENLRLSLKDYGLLTTGTKTQQLKRLLYKTGFPLNHILFLNWTFETLRKICKELLIPTTGGKGVIIEKIIARFPLANPEEIEKPTIDRLFLSMETDIKKLDKVLKYYKLDYEGSKKKIVEQLIYVSGIPIKEYLGKMFDKENLNYLCEVFNLPSTGTKKDLINRLLEKLPCANPQKVKIKILKPKEKIIKNLKPEEVEIKNSSNYIIFLSYATLDSQFFKIPLIANSLNKYPEIKKTLYWEKDSGVDIVDYMENNLGKCNVFILFCSQNSTNSSYVQSEWKSAFQLRHEGKLRIIPVFQSVTLIPNLLKPFLGIKYNEKDFDNFIQNLYHEIVREN